MELARAFATVAFAVVAVTSLFALGVRLVLLSRRGAGAAHVLGAAFLLLGFGNFRDPTNEIVHTAKEHKGRKENDQGGPPAEER